MTKPRRSHRGGRRAWILAAAASLSGLGWSGGARADDKACIAASEHQIVLRKQGKLHEALGELAVCAAPACPAEVKAECAKWVDALNTAMPSLILGAKDGSGNDVLDARVTMDGAPLPDALAGRPLAVDPGEHTFTFEVAGQPPVTRKLVLREGEKDRHEIVVIGPPGKTGVPEPPPPPSRFWTPHRIAAVTSGAVGLVSLGFGAAFGAYALSSQSREKSDCSSPTCAGRAQANEDYSTAVKDANASTATLVVGGVLIAGGVALWLTAPRDAPSAPKAGALRVAPVVAPGFAGLSVGGSFL